MNRVLPLVLAVMFLIAGIGSAAASESITANDAFNLLDPNFGGYDEDAFIIDVRSEAEWLGGHAGKNSIGGGAFLEEPIRKVMNIPYFNNPLFNVAVNQKFDTDDTLIVMCLAGGRSPLACDRLESLNFKHSYNLAVGFSGWQLANLPWNTDYDGVWDPNSYVPLPGTILLLGSGLLLLGSLLRKRQP